VLLKIIIIVIKICPLVYRRCLVWILSWIILIIYIKRILLLMF